MADQAQEALDLEAVATQLNGVTAGIVALEAALAAAGGTTPAVDAALADVKAAASGASAALPQAPVVPPAA